MKYTIIVIALMHLQCANAQNPKGQSSNIYRKEAEEILSETLTNKNAHNVIAANKVLIPDSALAIAVAEPLLFSIYGKENIERQQPYHAYFIDKYWVILGDLPKDYLGGTFSIVINSTNGQVLRISHGK